MQNESNEYRTKDIYVSSYLFMLNKHLQTIDQPTPRRYEFVFEMSDDLIKSVEDFYAKRVRVEPMEYALAMKRLKSRMYDNER